MIADREPQDRSSREQIGMRCRRWLTVAAIQLAAAPLAAPALAQDDAPAAPAVPEAVPDEPEQEPDRIDLLEERIATLTERLAKSEEERLKSVSPLSWQGYVDFGFFAPIGNRGAGWVQDFGNMQFPQYGSYSWTFLGDILATAVNTRGEVADLGDAPGITRFDSVNSDGGAGFLVNEINLRPKFVLSENAIVRASLNFVPRSGENFSLGDFFDADLAEVEYLVTADGKTSVFAGKILPVFGIEYKERKSDQRFGITPSLISRYTTGSQLGLKFRSKLLDDWLVLAGSVTNNSSTIESFHFYSEVDKNIGKTLNGRGAISLPIGRRDRLELGLSGEWGPQDRATDSDGKIWFAGVDLQYLGTSFTLKIQGMRGHAPGRADEGVWGLDLKPSGYVELDWQILAQFGFSLRAELRDAIVTLGSERIYVTKEARYTGGLRFVLGPHVAGKVEYLHNDEYGGVHDFSNDVFTSSLVLAL